MAEVKVTVKNVVEGSRDIKKAGNDFRDIEKASGGLNSKLEILKNSFGAVAGAAVTFRQAFEFGKQGLEIDQLAQSFDNMNDSILHTPGLLEDMSHAVRGTVSDVELMQGVLKLTAGASDEASRRFAEASPRLAEIAKAANKLNPTLGSTAFLFDSISTGIKRGSPLILDNLGLQIKLGEANEAYAAALGKTVEQLTNEEKTFALLNATMEAGDQLIQQAGGNVDSAVDSYARLEVEVQETTNAFKQWLGEGLLPTVKIINNDYRNAIDNIVDGHIQMSRSAATVTESMQMLTEQYNKSREGLTVFTGASRVYIQEINAQIAKNADLGDTYQEMAQGVQDFLGVGGELNGLYLKLDNGLSIYLPDLERAVKIQKELEMQTEANTADLVHFNNAMTEFTPVLRDTTLQQEEFADKIAQTNAQLTEEEAAIAAANAGLGEYKTQAESMTETQEAFNRKLGNSVSQLQSLSAEIMAVEGRHVVDVVVRVSGDSLTDIRGILSGGFGGAIRGLRGGDVGGGMTGDVTGEGDPFRGAAEERQQGFDDAANDAARGASGRGNAQPQVNNYFNFNNMPVSPAVVSQQVANSFGGAAR